jgi:hypothetical protein
MKQHPYFRCTHYASNEVHIGGGHINPLIYIGEYDQTRKGASSDHWHGE